MEAMEQEEKIVKEKLEEVEKSRAPIDFFVRPCVAMLKNSKSDLLSFIIFYSTKRHSMRTGHEMLHWEQRRSKRYHKSTRLLLAR